MKLKSIVIVIAVLAVLSAAVWFVQRPAAPITADARVGQTLADSAVLLGAKQFRLSDQGKTVSLVKGTDGSWTVTSFHDLPADFAKLARFTGDLSAAKIQRLVTTSAERIARLDFKDTQVSFLDGAGHEIWGVTLGKNADSGGGRFVRFGTEQKAYLTNFHGFIEAESKSWANTELLNLKPETIARIKIPFENGEPVIVARGKKEDPWSAEKTPVGEKLKADQITSLLSTLTNIRFTAVNEPSDPAVAAAQTHSRAFELTTFEGKTVTVTFARQPEIKTPKPRAAETKPATEPKPEPPIPGGATADAVAASPKPVEPPAPEFITTPAGPVFVAIAHSDPASAVNGMMTKLAFQMEDYSFTGLPQKPDELFESPPAASVAAPAPISLLPSHSEPSTSPAPDQPKQP